MTSRFVLPFADVGSGILPSDGAKLTFKNPGLETLKNTFSDSTGLTPNANPVVSDATGLFSNIYINGNYDVVLQDKNNVQIWADSVSEFATTSDNAVVKNFATLALAVADTSLVDGDSLNIAERTTGNGGGAMWRVVLSSTVTENTFNIVQGVGVGTLSLVLRQDDGIANVKEWGATGDGATDDTAAISAAIASFTDNEGGAIYFPIGVYKTLSPLVLDKRGLRLYGESMRGAILWYTGTGDAISADRVSSEIDHLHVTSLDPATTNHLNGFVGTGTATCGVRVNHTSCNVHHCTFSYFNDVSLFASAIKTVEGSVTLGFSINIVDNYIRFCWGGVELSGVNTDSAIEKNTILDSTKYGISVGYIWRTATQSSLTGDNIRIIRNLINSVNLTANPDGKTGDGYGITVRRGSVIDITGNYIEGYDAQTGSTAYGIHLDGITSGASLLATTINSNNAVSAESGVDAFSLFVTNAWYGNGEGNHFEGGAGIAEFSTDSKWFEMGVNFFTGGNSAPWTIGGIANRAYNAILNRIETTSGNVLDVDYGLRFNSRNLDKQFTLAADSGAPSVTDGNLYITANTVSTTYNNFNGSDGQTIKIIFKDSNSTVDFTGTSLRGNIGVDWVARVDDHMTCTRSAGVWYCDVSDNVAG